MPAANKNEITWKGWALMVAEQAGIVDVPMVEKVLRAANKLTGPELDFDCELSNVVNNLDPEEF